MIHHPIIPPCNTLNYILILLVIHFYIYINMYICMYVYIWGNTFTYPSLTVPSLFQNLILFHLKAMMAIKIRKGRKMQKLIKRPFFWWVPGRFTGMCTIFPENVKLTFNFLKEDIQSILVICTIKILNSNNTVMKQINLKVFPTILWLCHKAHFIFCQLNIHVYHWHKLIFNHYIYKTFT